MANINWKLKAAMVLLDGSQVEFCQRNNLRPNKVSTIVRGYRTPRPDELKKFRKGLGEELFAAAFPEFANEN